MYGLQKDVNLKFLNKRELLQVCVGLFQVILNFDEDVSISIEGRFEFVLEGRSTERAQLPEAASPILRFLGSRISDVRVQDGGTLELAFSNGAVLRLYDSNLDAESYQISGPAKLIVV